MARESLLLAMQFLAQYAKDKQQEARTKVESSKVSTIVNVNAPVGQFIANVEHLNTKKD